MLDESARRLLSEGVDQDAISVVPHGLGLAKSKAEELSNEELGQLISNDANSNPFGAEISEVTIQAVDGDIVVVRGKSYRYDETTKMWKLQ